MKPSALLFCAATSSLFTACGGGAPAPAAEEHAPDTVAIATAATAAWTMSAMEVPAANVTGWGGPVAEYMGAPHLYISRVQEGEGQELNVQVVIPHNANEQYQVVGPPVDMGGYLELSFKLVQENDVPAGLSTFRSDAPYPLSGSDQFRVSVQGSTHYNHLYVNNGDMEAAALGTTIPHGYRRWIGSADLGHLSVSAFFRVDGNYKVVFGKEDGSCTSSAPYVMAADETAATPGTVGDFIWLQKTIFPDVEICSIVRLFVNNKAANGRKYEFSISATEPA